MNLILNAYNGSMIMLTKDLAQRDEAMVASWLFLMKLSFIFFLKFS